MATLSGNTLTLESGVVIIVNQITAIEPTDSTQYDVITTDGGHFTIQESDYPISSLVTLLS